MATIGFVGLGNMGGALAANLVGAGHDVLATDLAGPDRCPEGATFTAEVAAVVAAAPVVVLSLPDGRAAAAVADDIAGAPQRVTTHVVDTSTVGPGPAAAMARRLRDAGVGYVDAPVSGGAAGARARTLAVMYAGRPDDRAAVQHVLEGLSDRRFPVGDEPGMAQALKLANNFLSATSLAATSEAVAFCSAAGLEMATVLEVLNASSGRTSASEDKFPQHVLTGTYASGFLNTLMAKDLRLYLESVEATGTTSTVGAVTAAVWQRFADAEPGVDFTAIHRFTAGEGA